MINVCKVKIWMKCVHPFGTGRHKRQADITLLFQYIVIIIWASAWDFQQCGMCDQQSLGSACSYGQSDQSLCLSLEYFMTIKLLTEHFLEVLSLTGGCTGSSQSTLVKMPHCWKSHATAHFSVGFRKQIYTFNNLTLRLTILNPVKSYFESSSYKWWVHYYRKYGTLFNYLKHSHGGLLPKLLKWYHFTKQNSHQSQNKKIFKQHLLNMLGQIQSNFVQLFLMRPSTKITQTVPLN